MTRFPDWTAFTPEAVAAELPRLMADAERAVAAVEASAPPSYEALVWALDDATRPLMRSWSGVGHMLAVMNSPAWRRLEEEWQPKIVAFSLRVGQSPAVYRAAKALLAVETDPVRRRILGRMALDAELSGVALAEAARARFNAISADLARLGADFHNAVIDATTDEISDANYPETMKHSPDRALRERLYRLRTTRAPENAPRVAEILRLRRELAALLGFADYAALSLATKCAPSAAAVERMIDELDAATAGLAAHEEEELADEFRRTDPGLRLEPWDRAFAAERLRERRYSYSEEELKRHFEFEDVLRGLFRLSGFLFGISVEELSGADRPPVWHGDVRFFRVREGGETVAHFYLDPYVRTGLKSGGAWMNDFRCRSVRHGRTEELPLCLVALNLPRPGADGRCLLPFREVETLFHEFGHALQAMLTRVGEPDAAGTNLVEWDAVEVASQFMENWCLDGRTGIAVPEDLRRKVRAAKNVRAASACRRQLAFASTDLRLHSGAGPVADADAVKAEAFARFGLPTLPGDGFLNGFTHVFAGGYAAGYYGYKWAEVMSADCFGAFEEAGLGDDAAMRREGRRYRDTVLALGGGESALSVFRRFRGRAPEIAALLRQQGLSAHGEECAVKGK